MKANTLGERRGYWCYPEGLEELGRFLFRSLTGSSSSVAPRSFQDDIGTFCTG